MIWIEKLVDKVYVFFLHQDDLVKDYGVILRESAILTSFSGFLFGFLLNISTLFLGLQLAMSFLVGNIVVSFLLEAIPFVLIYAFYKLRKFKTQI